MRLFGKEEVNTGRQFEFDMAKAVCILGMVFVHCFEDLGLEAAGESSAAEYIFVTVLDSIFGAGTFMLCMGLGIAYSWKNDPEPLIRRGIKIFFLGYLLNLLRDGIPTALLALMGIATYTDALIGTLCTDIMPFAGLALLLFGLLKKGKLSDLALFLVALGMSVVGSFVRFIPFENPVAAALAGDLVGVVCPDMMDEMSSFPLLNWFIVVVMGYLYGKAIRRCRDCERYYKLSLPVSAAVLGSYMAVAIPRRLGMMNEDIAYYYHFSTPNALILFLGAVFAMSLYHFIGRLLSERAKKRIKTMSVNLNRTYCIHWVIIGWIHFFFRWYGFEGLSAAAVFPMGIAVFAAATTLAERLRKRTEKQTIKTGR